MHHEDVIELGRQVGGPQLPDRRDGVGDTSNDDEIVVVGVRADCDRGHRQPVRRGAEPGGDRRQRTTPGDHLVRPVGDRHTVAAPPELDPRVPGCDGRARRLTAFRTRRHAVRACHTMADQDPEYSDVAGWDRAIQQAPEAAVSRATLLLAGSAAGTSDRTIWYYAVARGSLELGRIDQARDAIRAAVDLVARRPHSDERWAVLMTAAAIDAEAGDVDAALRHLHTLEHEGRGVDLARVRLQQAYVLQHAGRLNDALLALDQCDRSLRDEDVGRDRFRMHLNRGLVLLQQGELDRAETDFLAAAGIAKELGLTSAEGQCHANLGVLYGRGRRVVDSVRSFDRAERLLEQAGRPSRITTGMEIDRAEVLMHSGLLDDAVAAARRALAAAGESGNAMVLGDALLMCARTQLHAGHRVAVSAGTAAGEHLLASGRADMVPHAESIRAHAELRLAKADDPAAFVLAEQLIGQLRGLGWHQQADELAAERIRAAWRLRAWDQVADDLAELRLHAFGTRRDLALLGWFAEAVARCLGGDGPGSIDACRQGLSFLDEITAEAVDLEARSAAMRLGNDLSRWIIEVAVEQDDPDLVLAASEGTRARALHEELDGREHHRPLTDDGARRLLAELRGRLSSRCLVQWVVSGERIQAVVCDETGNRLLDVADLRSVVRERDRLMVWLDRAAVEPDGSSARAMRAAGFLDELLLAPLGLPDGDTVVIVPVDELHGVPWSGLPSVADRPVVISPSCRLWLDADRRASSPIRSAGFVAGPDLAADDLERVALRRNYDRVDEATGAGATAATVRTMFGGHDLVHVAAHGRFRADRPLLSTFALADGEVTLHESVPDRVGARLAVLSSCEGGAHGGAGGSEVLGLASVLLARGAASVLAPLTVVRDLECGEFVSAIHDEMAAGTHFGPAVARVRARWLRDDDLSRWAVASSFCCFGSGATRRLDG